jgi:hypothetical protein
MEFNFTPTGEEKTVTETVKQWGTQGLKSGSFIAGVMAPIALVVVISRWLSPSSSNNS